MHSDNVYYSKVGIEGRPEGSPYVLVARKNGTFAVFWLESNDPRVSKITFVAERLAVKKPVLNNKIKVVEKASILTMHLYREIYYVADLMFRGIRFTPTFADSVKNWSN